MENRHRRGRERGTDVLGREGHREGKGEEGQGKG